MKSHPSHSSGFATLLSVLVVLAIASVLSVAGLLQGVNSSLFIDSHTQLYRATNYAHACAEEALEEMKYNGSYSSTGNITFSGSSETCSYLIVDVGGGVKHIRSTGNSGIAPRIATRKVKVVVASLAPAVITSWQEVDTF